MDNSGGWGGLTSSLLAELRDECRTCPIICFPINTIANTNNNSINNKGGGMARVPVNSALTYNALMSSVTVMVPLDEGSVNGISKHMAVDPTRPYHTSAILASAIDVATSSYRFGQGRGAPSGVGDWVSACKAPNSAALTVGSLGLCMPWDAPKVEENDLRTLAVSPKALTNSAWLKQGLPSKIHWFNRARKSEVANPLEPFSQNLSARGLSLRQDLQVDVLREALRRHGGTGRVSVSAFRTPLPVPLSFPLLYLPTVNQWGEATSSQQTVQQQLQLQVEDRILVSDVAAMACVECSSRCYEGLRAVADGLNGASHAIELELNRNNLERDDGVEIRETLGELAEAYAPRDDMDSDGSYS